ncbi:MAG: hypothetical protein JNM70_01140 [Anaerolineae bacterium]|nr:hypothetical protein [Anaerolineae bacterium]
MPRTATLNPRYLRLLSFIYDYIHCYGRPPTLREAGKAIGISSSAAITYALNKLVHFGYLERPQGRMRALRLTEAGYQALRKPSPQTIRDERDALQRENRLLRATCRQLQAQLQEFLPRS